jgi:lipoprotein-anchoring transpeptidase ErfK/SrfK
VPDYVTGSAKSDGRARLCTIRGQQETLYRIRGTNQPEYIGQAISSGFIHITNEDVIDQTPW